MARKHIVPSGEFTAGGELTPQARIALQTLGKPLNDAGEIENLGASTGYSNDELRDKIIEILNALKA